MIGLGIAAVGVAAFGIGIYAHNYHDTRFQEYHSDMLKYRQEGDEEALGRVLSDYNDDKQLDRAIDLMILREVGLIMFVMGTVFHLL